MIRQENVTSRDLELLNVALDHALTSQEQVEFNRRLSESPHLTTLYQQQRQLKSTMEQLPQRKVPHNFTLTRSEARKARRAGFLQPMFGWASAISALLVAVIFGSQLIFRNLSLAAPAPADSQVFSVQEDAPTSDMTVESEETTKSAVKEVYLLNWNYGAYGIGGVGGKGGFDGTGGVSINIYVTPMVSDTDVMAHGGGGISTEESPEEELMTELPLSQNLEEEEPIEDVPTEEIQTQENPTEEVQTEELQTEEGLAGEAETLTAVQVDREPPKIYGIDPEKVGTVLKTTPGAKFEDEEPLKEATREVSESKTDSLIPMPIMIALLSAALIFGLVWLYLKFNR